MDKFIQGKLSWHLVRLFQLETHTTNYAFRFYKGSMMIGRVYYHDYAEQLVLETAPYMTLTFTTLVHIMPFLDTKFFRLQRKLRQSLARKLKNSPNE